jgi:peptidoglycan-N-acetylmuramic acid deacetylase
MKITKIICLFLILICVLSVFVNASSECRWYLKRNGKNQPILDKCQEIIYKYDGIYLDKSHADADSERVLYLTFDVGYENGNVEKILDTLKKENVKVAFFILSHFIYENTDLVLRMIEEGHLVCNHTSKHLNLSRASAEDAEKSIKRLEEVYLEKTGNTLAPFFRFPEGAYSESSLELVSSLGYKSVFWSLAYADWDDKNQPNPEKAKEILLNNTHNGAIILLHPTSKTNAEILPELIKTWRNDGYSFGTLYDIK